MNINKHLITCDDDNAIMSSKEMVFFSLQDTGSLWSAETLLCDNFLENLVFRISRKPKCLITHVQRIYYCFQTHLNEQLFAALADFLIILNKRGQNISSRMIMGAKSRLNPDQSKALKNYLKDADANISLLSGNQYSIFTKGLLGLDKIIQQIKTDDEYGHDPLDLARDYIEYSQLEEAEQVLEKAILEQPTRLALHHELLALYQSTRNLTGFNQMLAELTLAGVAMTDEWKQLNNYFKAQAEHV